MADVNLGSRVCICRILAYLSNLVVWHMWATSFLLVLSFTGNHWQPFHQHRRLGASDWAVAAAQPQILRAVRLLRALVDEVRMASALIVFIAFVVVVTRLLWTDLGIHFVFTLICKILGVYVSHTPGAQTCARLASRSGRRRRPQGCCRSSPAPSSHHQQQQ